MASVVLSSVASKGASFIGSTLGINKIPFVGGKITGEIRGLFKGVAGNIGSKIDEALFGENEENRVVGPRLEDLQVQTSTYGDVIPQIFGKGRVAGNIIWSQKIKEIPVTTEVSSGSGKGGSFSNTTQTRTRFNYTLTFAVAICEGEIDSIHRYWADSKLINIADYCASFEVHKGSFEQQISSIIEAFEGADKTPAYKDLAYIVFENFDLTSFGNRIPNLTFEVDRQLVSSFEDDENNSENLLTAINLIPGSGEFVYDTKVQNKIYGYDLAGKWIQQGAKETINLNNSTSEADVKLSLQQMGETFPNLEWVSIICTWFADSLDISTATIAPRVEYKTGTITEPDLWSVGSYDRASAAQVTLDANGRPIYGGTPSDSSILNLITELKALGYKVMFYPMIFVDSPTKPWRGKMTGAASDVSGFFSKSEGYNNYINHYANLVKNKVDAFIIGTEMKALTAIQDVDDSFPAVDEFVSLAATVKTTMGATTKVSYAADWSEYHSTNGWFNMDKLWASPNIDFIGIDAYFPLTDEPQNNSYDLQKVVDGWTSGEGYDWYYSDVERTNKINFTGAEYAWKNIQYWWENTHTNPDDVQTDWVAEDKPIWFTEFGFPSVDGATNQPNVFYNPNSEDGGFPRFSKGYVDLLAQKLGIEATLRKWQNSSMIEEKFLWAWDARPYPFWPDLSDIWADGNVWSRGHFVQGKLGISTLAAIIKDICARADIDENEIDITQAQQTLEGYILKNRSNGFNALSFVTEPNFIFLNEDEEKLNFINKANAAVIDINIEDLILDDEGEHIKLTAISEQNLPERIDVNYIDSKSGYLKGSQSANRDGKTGLKKKELNLPVVMPKSRAENIAEKFLLDEWASSKAASFKIDRSKIYVEAGDNVRLLDENGDVKYSIYVTAIQKGEQNNLQVFGLFYEKSIYDEYDNELLDDSANTEPLTVVSDTYFEVLNLPLLKGDDESKINIFIAGAPESANWNGAEIYLSESGEADEFSKVAVVEGAATIGSIIEDLPSSSAYFLDEVSSFDVALISGELESKSDEAFVTSKSCYAIVGEEIIKFQNAELVAENTYKISNILRGQFGTEDKITTHLAGTRFVLLNDQLAKISLRLAFLNKNVAFKAVSFGNLVENAEVKNADITGENLRPYSVVNLEADKDNGSGDITITFSRRSRISDNWATATPPLAEQSEKYEMDIVNDQDEIVRSLTSMDAKFTYLSTEQIEDFGSEISNLTARIYQISDLTGRGDKALLEWSF